VIRLFDRYPTTAVLLMLLIVVLEALALGWAP
jgi:hypothetical protein